MVRNCCICLLCACVFYCIGSFPPTGGCAEPVQSYLILVSRSGERVESMLQEQGIQVNMKLEEWYLAEAGRDDLERFDRMRIDYQVVDDQAWSEPYFLISRPKMEVLDRIPDRGKVIYQTEREALVKVTDGHALALAQAGFRLTRLFRKPLPLGPGPAKTAALPQERFRLNDEVETIVGQVSEDSLQTYVQRLQDFRTRYFATDSIHAAAQWLYDTFLQFGYTDVIFDTCSARPYDVLIRNVIATKYGTVEPENVFVIGGHYDSIVHDGTNPLVWAPGADDNASGVVAALEAARILANYDLDYTVKFACWTAEEIGLYGAWDYAEKAFNRGEKIGLYINFDMIGHLDEDDPLRDVSVMRTASSQRFADLMVEVAEAYTTLVPRQRNAGGGSDHVPFIQYGFDIAYGEEGDFSPFWHRGSDVTDHMDFSYMKEVVQMGLGTLATLSLGLGRPNIVYGSIQFDEIEGNGNDRFEPGETIDLFVSLKNPGLGCASDVSAVLETSDPDVTITDDQASFPICEINAVVSNRDDPLAVSLSEGSEPHSIPFTLHIFEGGSGFQADLTFHLLTGQGKVLLVADDGNINNQDYYLEILNTLGIRYDIEEVGATTKSIPGDYENYAEIIWFTGPLESNTLTPEDQSALAAYLDTGGRLLLSGSLIGYDIGTTSFYRDYLHARYVSFMTMLHHLEGTSNPLAGDMEVSLASYGANAQGFAGETDPLGPAFSLFNYVQGADEDPGIITSSGSGALAVETAEYKLAYFSFGLEGIEPLEDRAQVLANVLAWFKGPGVDKADVDGNGTINILDALMAVNMLLGLHQGTEEQIARADLNYDGQINVLDVIGVVNAVLASGGGNKKSTISIEG